MTLARGEDLKTPFFGYPMGLTVLMNARSDDYFWGPYSSAGVVVSGLGQAGPGWHGYGSSHLARMKVTAVSKVLFYVMMIFGGPHPATVTTLEPICSQTITIRSTMYSCLLL